MKTIKISRCADGDWRVASRCTCKGEEPCPVNGAGRGAFGKTVADAVRGFRRLRREGWQAAAS